jgi:hypothetical protein
MYAQHLSQFSGGLGGNVSFSLFSNEDGSLMIVTIRVLLVFYKEEHDHLVGGGRIVGMDDLVVTQNISCTKDVVLVIILS